MSKEGPIQVAPLPTPLEIGAVQSSGQGINEMNRIEARLKAAEKIINSHNETGPIIWIRSPEDGLPDNPREWVTWSQKRGPVVLISEREIDRRNELGIG